MKKILGIVALGLLLILLQSCSSTGVKDISQLSAPSSTEANVYLKRTGGFVLGGLESHDDICAEICERTGCTVFSLDYSLAPEIKYPEFFLDAIRFYYFIKNITEGYRANKVVNY